MSRKVPVQRRTPYYPVGSVTRPNVIEQQFRELAEAEGWDVTKRGWPDFLCRRNGELMAVEVKGPHDGLSAEQYEAISDLRRAGIPTFVWSPGEGYTEVGPPVGESVFSIKATLAMVREAAQRGKPRLELVTTPVQWVFDESDPITIQQVRHQCLKSHQNHQKNPVFGKTGSWCSDLLVASQRYSVDKIFAVAGLPDRQKLEGNIYRVKRRAFQYAHEALHREIGVNRSCTECERVA